LLMWSFAHDYTANSACTVATPTVANNRISPRNLRKNFGTVAFLLKEYFAYPAGQMHLLSPQIKENDERKTFPLVISCGSYGKYEWCMREWLQ